MVMPVHGVVGSASEMMVDEVVTAMVKACDCEEVVVCTYVCMYMIVPVLECVHV
jgi:hypothetical protein